MDIPVLDPYRPKIDPAIDARKHSNPVLFDVYIQFKSYDGFMLCMDGLRDMKLVSPFILSFDKILTHCWPFLVLNFKSLGYKQGKSSRGANCCKF